MTKEQDQEKNNAWRHVQIARRPERPHTLDYVRQLFTDFVELHGDRHFGDDQAIIGGPARFEGRTVMVIGHQKGATTKENLARNFAQAMPEGYRKALRLMRHAEKFAMPLITFIDTPGASPGIESEERGQAQAIADNLLAMLTLQTPIISLVIGEGGSGGALAIGVADRILMMENAIYSVASPEASATILWHDAGQAKAAAEAMKITAADLKSFGIADDVIPEPSGGAQNDVAMTMETVRTHLLRHLRELEDVYKRGSEANVRKLLTQRQNKYQSIGVYQEHSIQALAEATLEPQITAPANLNGANHTEYDPEAEALQPDTAPSENGSSPKPANGRAKRKPAE